jgi:hypothetical protein
MRNITDLLREYSRRVPMGVPVGIITFMLVTVALYSYGYSVARGESLQKFFAGLRAVVLSPPILVGVLSSVVLLSAQGMLRYLRTDSEASRLSELRLASLMTEISLRQDRLERAKVGLDGEARNAILAGLRSDLTESFAGELQATMEKKYGPAMQLSERAAYLRLRSEAITQRLQTEIRALMKRGNLNLVLGTFTTGGAVLLLGYIAISATVTAENWRALIPSYMLRLSLVAFIEIFAFFFLRLYRTSLSEIKYFQNEITNLEAKALALELAILTDDRDAARRVAEEFARTERNFVLKKDETTVELEKSRIEGQHLRDLLAATSEALRVKK